MTTKHTQINLQLKPQGILTLRGSPSSQGEYPFCVFWRIVFRTLKRAENDAAERVAQHMGGYMRRYLCRKTMNKLWGRASMGLSCRSSMDRPARETCQYRPAEESINQLITYLEGNLKVLCDNLSESILSSCWSSTLLEGNLDGAGKCTPSTALRHARKKNCALNKMNAILFSSGYR